MAHQSARGSGSGTPTGSTTQPHRHGDRDGRDSSLPHPPSGQDGTLGRRASEGNLLENVHDRDVKQASASPTMGHAPGAGHADMDTGDVARDLSRVHISNTAPQSKPQPPPLNSYPSYDASTDAYFALAPHQQQQPTVFPHEAAYQGGSPYIPYQQMGAYYDYDVEYASVSVETMHGMPGYPGRPPIARSNRTSPMNPSPPFLSYDSTPTSHHGYGQLPYQSVPPAQYGGMYSGPSHGPDPRIGDRRQFGSFTGGTSSGAAHSNGRGGYSGNAGGVMGGGGSLRGRHSRHGSMVESWNAASSMGPGGPPPGNGVGRYSLGGPPAWSQPHPGMSPYPYGSYQMPGPARAHPGDDGMPSSAVEHRPGGAPPSPVQTYRPWPPQSPKAHNNNNNNNNHRMSFSGAANKTMPELTDKERERKAYHPQPPARRSDWVMWVGNVPTNTSHEELWRFFNHTVPPGDDPWRGPSSIFLISRSSCAFVNLSSQADLDRAVDFFNGLALRPQDPRCPRMVCRVRRKDDDLRAGVGAQRGTGMHREWVKAQQAGLDRVVDMLSPTDENKGMGLAINVGGATSGHSGGMGGEDGVMPSPSTASSVPPSPAILEHPPEGEGRRRDSVVDAVQDGQAATPARPVAHKSTHSYASTNSSFLAKHFPKRVFILKSSTTAELEQSVKSGTWRTQKHNESVLDQAFRTSQEVFLIFGANRSGEFFGYAKMVEPINKGRATSIASSKLTHGSMSVRSSVGPSPLPNGHSASEDHALRPKAQSSPCRMKQQQEEEERARATSDPTRPAFLLSHSQDRFATHSPRQLTPSEELDKEDLSSPTSEPVDGEMATANPRREDRHTDPIPPRAEDSVGDGHSFMSAPAVAAAHHQPRPHGLDRDALRAIRGEYMPAVPVRQAMAEEAQKQQAMGTSSRDAQTTSDGVKRKDTVVTGEEKKHKEEELVRTGEIPASTAKAGDAAEDGEALGSEFRIEWVRVGCMPFGRVRNVRNPWNADREVKVSRDGTEVEPGVGTTLMAEWDRVDFQPQQHGSMPTTPAIPQTAQQHRYAGP